MALANVTLTDTFDVWRVRTNQLINVYDETNSLARAAYNTTNSYVASTINVTANIITSNSVVYNTIYQNANVIANQILIDLSNELSNTTYNVANFALSTSNNAVYIANLAYDTANTFVANSANIVAEILAANNIIQNVINSSVTTLFVDYLANNDLTYVGAIANSGFIVANTASNTGNASFDTTNASFSVANAAILTGNNAYITANAAFIRANTGCTTAVVAFSRANVISTQSNASFNTANAAFIKANTGFLVQEVSDSASYYVTFTNSPSSTNTNTVNIQTTRLLFNPGTGTLSATIFNATSDISQKENITDIVDPIEKVRNMRGVGFDWKDNGNKSYGVIAQELEKILPELVEETDGVKSVNYSGIIAFLIEAIKELEKKIDSK